MLCKSIIYFFFRIFNPAPSATEDVETPKVDEREIAEVFPERREVAMVFHGAQETVQFHGVARPPADAVDFVHPSGKLFIQDFLRGLLQFPDLLEAVEGDAVPVQPVQFLHAVDEPCAQDMKRQLVAKNDILRLQAGAGGQKRHKKERKLLRIRKLQYSGHDFLNIADLVPQPQPHLGHGPEHFIEQRLVFRGDSKKEDFDDEAAAVRPCEGASQNERSRQFAIMAVRRAVVLRHEELLVQGNLVFQLRNARLPGDDLRQGVAERSADRDARQFMMEHQWLRTGEFVSDLAYLQLVHTTIVHLLAFLKSSSFSCLINCLTSYRLLSCH